MELGYRTMLECCSKVMADTPDPSEPSSVFPTIEWGVEASMTMMLFLLEEEAQPPPPPRPCSESMSC